MSVGLLQWESGDTCRAVIADSFHKLVTTNENVIEWLLWFLTMMFIIKEFTVLEIYLTQS